MTVTVTSDLSGTIYYHWYIDGAYIASTMSPAYSFYLAEDECVRVTCIDTNNASYDAIANAPAGYPARRSLWWVRSIDSDVSHYRVEQNKDAAGWTEIGIVHHDDTQWSYSFLTEPLTDLSSYQWRVYPVDAAGNDGTVITLGAETVVRTPDAPDFTISFDGDTDTVTYTAA